MAIISAILPLDKSTINVYNAVYNNVFYTLMVDI